MDPYAFPTTISTALADVWSSITGAVAPLASGALIYIPALALAGWGVKKVFGVFRRR